MTTTVPETIPGCAAALTTDQLAVLRDGGVSAERLARLEEHVAACPACQGRLAEYDALAAALRAISIPEPPDGYGRNPRHNPRVAPASHRIGGMTRLRWPRPDRVAAAAALLLVVSALAQMLWFGASMRSGWQTGKSAPTATAALPDANALWGAPTARLATTALGGERAFVPSGISPDGATLVGFIADQGTNALQPALWSMPSGRVTPLAGALDSAPGAGSSSASDSYTDIATDGRYVVYSVASQVGSGATTLYVYDLGAGAIIHSINLPADGAMVAPPIFQGPRAFFLDHGEIVIATAQKAPAGVEMIDAATGALHPLTPLGAAARPLAFAWPYLVYQTGATVDGARRIGDLMGVYDLSAAAPVDLSAMGPLLPGLARVAKENQGSLANLVAVSAAALFLVTVPDYHQYAVYEADWRAGATGKPRSIYEQEDLTGPFSGSRLRLAGANAWVIGIPRIGAIDLQTDTLTPFADALVVSVAGRYLMGARALSSYSYGYDPLDPYSVTIYDTSREGN